MANIVINPPVESTAIPLKAAPLVQPRAIWAPNPNNTPPPNAKINLRLLVIFEFRILYSQEHNTTMIASLLEE